MAGNKNERAAKGGGKVTDLSMPYNVNYSYQNTAAGITQGTGADWMGPLDPMTPSAPPEVAGRRFDFPVGYNLNQKPRAYEPITFEQLRGLADSYDILRLIIETRKDQMCNLRWNILPRDPDKKELTAQTKSRITEVEAFFKRPDKENPWGSWLRLVLEDLFVIDAPTLYKRRTNGGKLYGLMPMDGGSIKRVIDDWGHTPMAPSPAYQQVLKGLPAIDYTADEIIYRPRNIRTNKVYGLSPVEQIVMTVNIGIRRQVWQLQTFTEGNIPEALIGTPVDWTPSQISAFQTAFDAMLEGNTAQRSKALFVPGEIAKGYMQTKPTELFGAAEDWLARVTCFAFSVSPQPFLKMMNRATAETSKEQAEEEGLAPIQGWLKEVIDDIILNDFGYDDVEFGWREEKTLDPKVQSEVITSYVSKAVLSINEGREELGRDPLPGDIYDTPMVLTATGYVSVEQSTAPAAGAIGPDGQPLPVDATGKPSAGAGAPKDEGSKKNSVDEEKANAAPPEKPEKLAKYSDDQPRDDHGRFGTGSGSGQSKEGGAGAKTSASFVSPNTGNLDFNGAVAEINSERSQMFAEACKDIDSQLGLKGEEVAVIGAWSDGAENSTMFSGSGNDPALLEASAAMKGYIGDQKAVLTFTPSANGEATLYDMRVPSSLADTHQEMLANNVPFHTLVADGNGSRVLVVDMDGSAGHGVASVAEKYNVQVSHSSGEAKFIGTSKEDGTDREQRDDAKVHYEAAIRSLQASSVSQGATIGRTWEAVRDRWTAPLAQVGKFLGRANDYLRGRGTDSGAVSLIDAALAKHILPANKILYRGAPSITGAAFAPGQLLRDLAFLLTTEDFSAVEKFDTVFELEVPAGVPALPGGVDYLLPRGVDIRIESVACNGAYTHIKASVLP